jgi:hypothetical protein
VEAIGPGACRNYAGHSRHMSCERTGCSGRSSNGQRKACERKERSGECPNFLEHLHVV